LPDSNLDSNMRVTSSFDFMSQ